MIVKLLTEHHLEFLSLKEGCRGSSESTLVKMSSFFKFHAAAHMSLFFQEPQADGSNGSTVVRNKVGDRENGPANTRQQETHHHQSDPAVVTLSGMYHHTSL